MIAWSGMGIPGAQLILAGEFALVPAIRMKEQVSQEITQYTFETLEFYLKGCQTTDGEACNFPFSYDGTTYNDCMEWNGNPWCTTASGWGICSSSCNQNEATSQLRRASFQ